MAQLTEAQREHVLRLARAGDLSRNAIAKATGVSAGSVTNICRDAGVSFERTATEAAVKARKIDLAARRTELQAQLLEDAARLRVRLWQPYELVELGMTKTGETSTQRWFTVELDTPPPADQLKIMQATTLAITTELKMADQAGSGDNDHAKAMLVQLFGALDGEWRELQASDAGA